VWILNDLSVLRMNETIEIEIAVEIEIATSFLNWKPKELTRS
jgi:hypothetical protein